jgi:hypothetical protein
MSSSNPKILIVEGRSDKWAVQGLMSKHVSWPKEEEKWPVHIECQHTESHDQDNAGLKAITKSGYLSAQVKTHDIVGVIVDSDGDHLARYNALRELCKPMFPAIPKQPSKDGIIVNGEDDKRLGLWMMPDNVSSGNLEVFFRYLVPGHMAGVFQHAVDSTRDARAIGATCKEKDIDKAHLYVFLAWNDEPAQAITTALARKILDPEAGFALPFIKWFCELYGVTASGVF